MPRRTLQRKGVVCLSCEATHGKPADRDGFLFTDIEGFTRLLQQFGDRRYADILAQRRYSQASKEDHFPWQELS